MYVTPRQLARGQGQLDELAQLFVLDAALLLATLNGADRSAYSAEQIAAADQALADIESVIADTDAEINAYLAQRGYPLPQSAEAFPILTTWARKIARYHLNPQRDRTSEETGRIERDYREARQALTLIADGKLSLGAGDPLAPPTSPTAGGVQFVAPARVFTAATLADL